MMTTHLTHGALNTTFCGRALDLLDGEEAATSVRRDMPLDQVAAMTNCAGCLRKWYTIKS